MDLLINSFALFILFILSIRELKLVQPVNSALLIVFIALGHISRIDKGSLYATCPL